MSRRSRQACAQLEAFRGAAQQLCERDDPADQLAGRLALIEPINLHRDRAGNLSESTIWSFWYQKLNGQLRIERSAERRMLFCPGVGKLIVSGIFVNWGPYARDPFTAVLEPNLMKFGSHQLLAQYDVGWKGLMIATDMTLGIENGVSTPRPVPDSRAEALLGSHADGDPTAILWLRQNPEEVQPEQL